MSRAFIVLFMVVLIKKEEKKPLVFLHELKGLSPIRRKHFGETLSETTESFHSG